MNTPITLEEIRPNARTALNLRRSVLMPIHYVRLAHLWTVERVKAAVDTGELDWVWDISAGDRDLRILRFWTREVIAPEMCILLRTQTVIGSILGTRAFWHTAAMGDLLQCSRKHVHDLFDCEAIQRETVEGSVGATWDGLAKFLKERLVTP
jgi:hypothetical protein